MQVKAILRQEIMIDKVFSELFLLERERESEKNRGKVYSCCSTVHCVQLR